MIETALVINALEVLTDAGDWQTVTQAQDILWSALKQAALTGDLEALDMCQTYEVSLD